jgi:hypothetical protein
MVKTMSGEDALCDLLVVVCCVCCKEAELDECCECGRKIDNFFMDCLRSCTTCVGSGVRSVCGDHCYDECGRHPRSRPELTCGFRRCCCDSLPMCVTCLCYDALCECCSGMHDPAMDGTCAPCECASCLEILPCCQRMPWCDQYVTDGACCRIGRVIMSRPYCNLLRATCCCWCCFCADGKGSPHSAWYAGRRAKRDHIRNVRRHRAGVLCSSSFSATPSGATKQPTPCEIQGDDHDGFEAPLLVDAGVDHDATQRHRGAAHAKMTLDVDAIEMDDILSRRANDDEIAEISVDDGNMDTNRMLEERKLLMRRRLVSSCRNWCARFFFYYF